MNIEIDKTIAYGGARYKAGTKHTVDDELGVYLVDCGYAHEIAELQTVEIAVDDMELKFSAEMKHG